MRAMISMYDMPERRPAIEAWWAGLDAALAGGRPARHPRRRTHMTDSDLYELWLAPDLFIAQTCGFPLTHRLKDRVTLVATPVYAVDGCAGGQLSQRDRGAPGLRCAQPR